MTRTRKTGPKPKPTALKKAEGNLGKRDLNEREPEYETLTSISAPESLIDDVAIQAWDFYMPELVGSKILTVIDIHNLEQFCNAMAYVRQMDEVIEASGHFMTTKTGLKKHPAHAIRNENIRHLDKFGSLLGLDPSSRVNLIGKDKGKDAKNNFSEF